MWQFFAAKAIEKKMDGKSNQPIIINTPKVTKKGLIITGTIIGGLVVFFVSRSIYLSIRKANALKLGEANNAKDIYTIIRSGLSKGILDWLNPVTLAVNTSILLPKTIAESIWGPSGKNDAYEAVSRLNVQDTSELLKAYHGIYSRHLEKDLLHVLGDENFGKLNAKWRITDFSILGYKKDDTGYSIKQGTQIAHYVPGHYAEYENKYGLVIKNTDGFYVNRNVQVPKLVQLKFKAGNYAGRAEGFTFGGQTIKGGMIYTASNGTVGLYMMAKINGNNVPVLVPVDSLLLFNTLSEMNNYAFSKDIRVTNISI